jgi:hypothetical protein
MFANQYEEHLASQPDNSRWDGFDRGTVWANESPSTRVIGRMTNEAGQRVEILEVEFSEGEADYSVFVNNNRVFFDSNCRQRAVVVARWWMDGCPA